MRLAAPSFILFLLSTVLVVLVILSKYFGMQIPILSPIVAKSPFEVVLVAWGMLFIGVVFNV